jgi:hypothetical protein
MATVWRKDPCGHPVMPPSPHRCQDNPATIAYGLGMASDQASVAPLGAVPILWYTVAFNLTALLISVVGIGFNDEAIWPLESPRV